VKNKIKVCSILLLCAVSLFGCGGVEVKQNNTELEVGTTFLNWEEYITVVEPEKYNISADASQVDINTLGEYTVTYYIENKKNKKVETIEYQFAIIDTTAPVINLKEESLEIRMGKEFDPLDIITVEDNYDILEIEDVQVENNVDINQLGEYTVSYTIEDSSGNKGEAILTVSVIKKLIASELETELSTQPVTISSTKYIVQDSSYKIIYPDMLQAVLQNNTASDIRDAIVAFIGWDKNGLPVKIRGQYDHSLTDGTYIKQCRYKDINLAAGQSFGKGYGFALNPDIQIKNFKAIVVSYTTFEEETWENPLFTDWCELYSGKKFNSWE